MKEELGQLIKKKREAKKLSQKNLCGNEEELTVRQLQRIEKGKSLPTLEKLDYIARMLELPISALLGENDLQIPDEYFELKNRIVKFPTYGDKARIDQKMKMIEEIYDNYFEVLPEDELLFLDLTESLLGGIHEKVLPNIEEIYDDAFEQVLKKKVFHYNDYLYIDYFLFKCQKEKYYDKNILKKIERKILKQSLTFEELYNIELLMSVMNLIGVYVSHDDYQDTMPLIEKGYRIIDKAQLHTYKPGLLEVEARYPIRVEGNKEKSKEIYQQALMLGEILGDQVIINDIKKEMKIDGIE